MSNSIKMRVSKADDGTRVRILIRHPMETGLRKDSKTKKFIPAHFIKEVNCAQNGKPVLSADWGIAVSKNPYLSFYLDKVKKGDKISVQWKDNKGQQDSFVYTV